MHDSQARIFDRKSFFLQIRNGPWAIYAILMAFILFNVIFNQFFWTELNISNVISQSTALILVSIGQSFAIIGGGFDFSVGGVVSLSTCVIATQMQNSSLSILLVVALVLCIGTAIGVINGTGVTLFRINPFIMTLGTMTIAQGVSFLFREYAGGYVPPPYIKAMTGNVGFVPTPVLLMIGAVVVGVGLSKKTRFGRYVYAIGGNEESARAGGINVGGIRIFSYIVSALFATVGGLFMAGRIASGDPRIGESLPLDSITAVVLGGVIIGGGRGSLIGAIAGVFLIIVLNNALTLFNISPYYHYIIKGVLLGVAVAITFRNEERKYL
jgi:ribose transport system permease protein